MQLDPVKLLQLADRAEKASGPDRELDFDIFRAFNPEYAGPEWREYGGGLRHMNDGSDMRCLPPAHLTPPRWTGSFDAAQTLVPEGRSVHLEYDHTGRAICYVIPPGFPCGHARAATSALALCSASFRALAQALFAQKHVKGS